MNIAQTMSSAIMPQDTLQGPGGYLVPPVPSKCVLGHFSAFLGHWGARLHPAPAGGHRPRQGAVLDCVGWFNAMRAYVHGQGRGGPGNVTGPLNESESSGFRT